ncbi:MAG: hypothetical protein CM15mP93_08810 [Thiotrichaceae bacterium]|nr:MAG: hypothetical protein CM15mP93_08810 [Thiotrichaceae bacterium]
MSKELIMHMITTEKNLSPFDVNMAIDAGWEKCVPYTNIASDEVIRIGSRCNLFKATRFK